MTQAKPGDLVLLISPEHKRYLIRLNPGERWFSHRGFIAHDALIGQPLGRTILTDYGRPFLALEPSTSDLIQDLPRMTQIIYGKDAAQIALRLNLYPGRTVLEAGTGSGALTFVLARAVMPTGHVYTYETRQDAFDTARANLASLGLLPYITVHNENISGGFHQSDVDACFFDLREPWLFLEHAWNALKGSGFFGALVPTTNQVSDLLTGLQALPFGDISVEEVLIRNYKTVPSRLRPEDRMLAHSGFLVFARKLARDDQSLTWMPDKRRRQHMAREAMAARAAAESESAMDSLAEEDEELASE